VDLCLGGFVLPFARELGYSWHDLFYITEPSFDVVVSSLGLDLVLHS